ncbi:MAG TPA: hypothetical protein VKR31_02290 [Rhizomicrobium sp.]|nr:hypothetical protein [Rhizomicrobium sp.]
MRVAIIAVSAAIVWNVVPAVASDSSDVTASVQKANDSFNKGNKAEWLATCGAEPVIVDNFAPYRWDGATACEDYWNANEADSKKNGITDEVVTLGKPWHIAVTDDRAYVVVPTTDTYKEKGKPVTRTGSVWTFTLQKVASGWLVTGMAWGQH